MADDPLPSLADLDRRLKEARKTVPAEPERDALPRSSNALGSAMRLGVEFVSGFVVGGLIGWALDRWFGSRPWLMIVFFLLGAAAGMLNLIRAARRLQAEAEAREEQDSSTRG
ncbi:AtpZ/AtpI family protein [Zavarzinia compransoris]|uniref:AtpZ/AtpI family protein n=1 Tax=Zavarzinia marina TaxID=2911065 RepID=UPI001F2DF663|nr:AtpZ/AtpI family protein [Zavarzinia marina]MCF4165136.1 AtpZ/AtpI family protein [Zavarzinia marina]